MTPHFTFDEAVKTNAGLGNMPSARVAAQIGVTACHMEKVREILGNHSIHVSSWYRSPAVNLEVGGVSTSDHLRGVAVDFTCPEFGSTYDVATRIRDSGIKFDQLILEYGWVHISFNATMRQQCLTKKSKSSPYVTGLIE